MKGLSTTQFSTTTGLSLVLFGRYSPGTAMCQQLEAVFTVGLVFFFSLVLGFGLALFSLWLGAWSATRDSYDEERSIRTREEH